MLLRKGEFPNGGKPIFPIIDEDAEKHAWGI